MFACIRVYLYTSIQMLYKPLLHGTYVDDIFFGVVFVVMLAVFLYFYFSDKGEPEMEDEEEKGSPKNKP